MSALKVNLLNDIDHKIRCVARELNALNVSKRADPGDTYEVSLSKGSLLLCVDGQEIVVTGSYMPTQYPGCQAKPEASFPVLRAAQDIARELDDYFLPLYREHRTRSEEAHREFLRKRRRCLDAAEDISRATGEPRTIDRVQDEFSISIGGFDLDFEGKVVLNPESTTLELSAPPATMARIVAMLYQTRHEDHAVPQLV